MLNLSQLAKSTITCFQAQTASDRAAMARKVALDAKAKEKQDAVRYANESLIEQLLPTMDSFEMAMSAVQNADNSTIDSLKTGIEMVYTQLKRTLEEVGLIEINATGQKFDPSQHEAVSRKKTDEADETSLARLVSS